MFLTFSNAPWLYIYIYDYHSSHLYKGLWLQTRAFRLLIDDRSLRGCGGDVDSLPEDQNIPRRHLRTHHRCVTVMSRDIARLVQVALLKRRTSRPNLRQGAVTERRWQTLNHHRFWIFPA